MIVIITTFITSMTTVGNIDVNNFSYILQIIILILRKILEMLGSTSLFSARSLEACFFD